jgi:tubulin--tyrosine ligase
MSDKAQGIRMFSSEAELVEIFEAFEPESDDEEDGTEEEEDVVAAESNAISRDELRRIEQLAVKEFPDDEPYEEPENANKAEAETDVQTSQLRHFVIQVRICTTSLLNRRLMFLI